MDATGIQKYYHLKLGEIGIAHSEFVSDYIAWCEECNSKIDSVFKYYRIGSLGNIDKGRLSPGEGMSKSQLNTVLYYLQIAAGADNADVPKKSNSDINKSNYVVVAIAEVDRLSAEGSKTDFPNTIDFSDISGGRFIYAINLPAYDTADKINDVEPSCVIGYYDVSDTTSPVIEDGIAFLFFEEDQKLIPNGTWTSYPAGVFFNSKGGMMYEFKLDRRMHQDSDGNTKGDRNGVIVLKKVDSKETVLGFESYWTGIIHDFGVRTNTGKIYCEKLPSRDDDFQQVIQQCAATFLNRVVSVS